jgi:hypothetical protein
MFFALLSLAVATLNSANAYFADILRARARPDYINANSTFYLLQRDVLIASVIPAIINTAFAIFGAIVVVHPRWLRGDYRSILEKYGLQVLLALVILAIIMIGMGGYLSVKVHGLQGSFEKFGANDSIPYYSIMYWGGVAQSSYGVALLILAAVIFFQPGVLYLTGHM